MAGCTGRWVGVERSSWIGARVKGKGGFAGRERVRDMAGFQPGVGHQGQSQNGNLISVWGLVRLTCLKGSQTDVSRRQRYMSMCQEKGLGELALTPAPGVQLLIS